MVTTGPSPVTKHDQDSPLASLTLYLHGQGISNDTARAHVAWIRAVTGMEMVPLFYHDVVDDGPLSILGLPLRAPLATTAHLQLADYLAALDPDSDQAASMRLPEQAIKRAHLYETYRSALRYLTKHSINSEVRASLVQQILEAVALQPTDDGPVILVAHSLGSVIALDLLQDLPPGMRIDRFVTLGSPLGLITSLPGPLAESMVPNARRTVEIPWHDLAAEGDVLSTGQRIQRRRHFAAAPLSITTILGDFDNPHESYFIDPQVARAWVSACR
jgi:hypothetical protein